MTNVSWRKRAGTGFLNYKMSNLMFVKNSRKIGSERLRVLIFVLFWTSMSHQSQARLADQFDAIGAPISLNLDAIGRVQEVGNLVSVELA